LKKVSHTDLEQLDSKL